MFRLIKLSFLICATTFIISCNHSNTLGKMIPADATLIVHLNGHSLSNKLSWQEIKQSNWFNRALNDSFTEDWMKKVMQDPETSGIDSKGDLVFFIEQTGKTSANIVVEGDLKDEKNFENFAKNISTGDVQRTDNLKVLSLKHEGAAGWHNKKFVFVFNKKINNASDSNIAISAGITGLDASAICKNIFALKEDSSMRNNNNFTTLLNEPADIHVWQNNEQAFNNFPMPGMLGMLKLDVFIKNNVSTYSVNFEDGKIDVKQHAYLSKELIKVLKDYGGGSINTQMIKNIPYRDVSALVSLHFKPQGIEELIRLTGLDGFVNLFLSKAGFSIEDFVKANKGDILFTLSDFKVKKDSLNDSSSSYHPSGKFLFSATIGDKASFNKLIDAGKKLSAGKINNDSGVSYTMNDQYFVFGNDLTNQNKFLSGGNSSFSFLDDIQGHPLGAYIDINKILTNIAEASKDTAVQNLIKANLKIWDKVIASGGEIDDGSMHMHQQIFLVDKKTNSLKQLNTFLDQVSTTENRKMFHHHLKEFNHKGNTIDSSQTK